MARTRLPSLTTIDPLLPLAFIRPQHCTVGGELPRFSFANAELSGAYFPFALQSASGAIQLQTFGVQKRIPVQIRPTVMRVGCFAARGSQPGRWEEVRIEVSI